MERKKKGKNMIDMYYMKKLNKRNFSVIKARKEEKWNMSLNADNSGNGE